MAYVDYDWYKTKYYGNVIASDDFPRLAERASEKLDALTFYRLVDNFPSDERVSVKVKNAVCAMAELIGDAEKASANIRSAGGGVKSVSSGSESITYADVNTSASVADFNKMLYAKVKEYLSGTGLLYAGM